MIPKQTSASAVASLGFPWPSSVSERRRTRGEEAGDDDGPPDGARGSGSRPDGIEHHPTADPRRAPLRRLGPGSRRRGAVGHRTAPSGRRAWKTLAAALDPPRVVWLMVPAGEPTEALPVRAADHLQPGDIVIDGGNTHYTRRHPTGERTAGARDPVRRLRHQRGRVRAGARLLPDGRWGRRCRGSPRTHLRIARPGRRRRSTDARPRWGSDTRGAGVPPLRTGRVRALREDGPQRHRVRADGLLRGGVQHPEARRDRPRRLPDRRRRGGGGLASRERGVVVVARPVRGRPA